MKDFDEVIFNLFIFEFIQDYCHGERVIPSEIGYYDAITDNTFQLIKDCFPVGEIAWSNSLKGTFNYIIEDQND